MDYIKNVVVDGHTYRVPMSDSEVEERKAEEAAWMAKAPTREIAAIEAASGLSRVQRDLAIAALPVSHPVRQKAEAAETAIDALGVRSN